MAVTFHIFYASLSRTQRNGNETRQSNEETQYDTITNDKKQANSKGMSKLAMPNELQFCIEQKTKIFLWYSNDVRFFICSSSFFFVEFKNKNSDTLTFTTTHIFFLLFITHICILYFMYIKVS